MQNQGALVIVGSGIKSLAHMTVEAQGWIRQADIVLYCVSDPITEIWIKRNNPNSMDLVALYNRNRQRNETYGDMVSHLLYPVREGKLVCGVFYGHPGLFVTPTHKAIEIARAEGYPAFMLPGVSAVDCLYADVGFDPAVAGCQFFEATDLLVHRRVLHPENNVIVWQVGCVGDLASRIGVQNKNLSILVEYLTKFYDSECEVVHYQGSIFPVCEALVERLPLSGLVQAGVTTMSTLYIPPQRVVEVDRDMATRLGLIPLIPTPQPEKAATASSSSSAALAPMGPTSLGRSGLADFILATAVDPRLLETFQVSAEKVAAQSELSSEEVEALLSREPAQIRRAVKEATARK